jgi:rRNA processing protein Krr1/Pno1/predicted RNA-binding protein YlqC (UPF0109 family)
LIGRQGQTIQGISKRSGARINIPKNEDTVVDPDDEDPTVDVTIEGDAVAAELARRDIQSIIDERTSRVNMRLKDIPAEYYPFLNRVQGLTNGHDINLSIPQYHTWQNAPPPQAPAKGQPIPFVPQENIPIRISGDRKSAEAVRKAIEQHAAELKRHLASRPVSIEQGRHQFIVGQNGEGLRDLIAETGCSVLVPPPEDDSETLYIVGPPNKLEGAVNRVLDQAASMSVSNIDLARQHARAPPFHPYFLSRYLKERQALADLERQYAASFVLPPSQQSPANWQIFSKDGKQGMRARAEAMNLIAAHPPSRFHAATIDPFYHTHLRTRAPQIRREQGVHLLFPPSEDTESHQIVLIYEQPGAPSEYKFPREAPTAAEIKEHELAIQKSKALLDSLFGNRGEVVSRQVEAPSKFHDKIQRYVDREQRGLDESQIPPQLFFTRGAGSNAFNIRGHASDVESLNTRILAFVEQEKKDELERGFTTSFEYPHKIAGHLVGKKGENIKKLQDEFDVEIHYTEGKVELKGPQAKCEACKTHITQLAKKLGDETTHQIKVATKYHGDLKGARGAQVHRLQDRYNVRINFPRQERPTADDDAATEASFRNQPAQAPDVVTIRGPKKGADEARDELLSLLQYTMDHSHSSTISVAVKQLGAIIGPQGKELESLRMETGCIIDIPKREENTGGSGERVDVTLKGTKQAVEAAKKILLEKVKHFDDQTTVLVEVDPKHFKNVIGPGGTTLQSIISAAGGPEDRRLANRMVQFPKAGSTETAIKLQGPKSVVDKVRKAIADIVAEKAGQVTESLSVPQDKHRSLIGQGGSVRRRIDSEFKVELHIPRAGEDGDVTITGKPEDVEKAKAHIETLLRDQGSETLEVPLHIHYVLAANGIFNQLRKEHGVNVDHAGKAIPPAPASAGASNGDSANKLPQEADDGSHTWLIIDQLPASQLVPGSSSETIPWIIRGNSNKVARAKDVVNRAISGADKPRSTGRLVLADPKTYRLVIGPSGSVVNRIRDETGTSVAVPNKGAGEDDGIEIKGRKEDVIQAKEMILEAIKRGERRRRNDD